MLSMEALGFILRKGLIMLLYCTYTYAVGEGVMD